jgi:hypothetical protein
MYLVNADRNFFRLHNLSDFHFWKDSRLIRFEFSYQEVLSSRTYLAAQIDEEWPHSGRLGKVPTCIVGESFRNNSKDLESSAA